MLTDKKLISKGVIAYDSIDMTCSNGKIIVTENGSVVGRLRIGEGVIVKGGYCSVS